MTEIVNLKYLRLLTILASFFMMIDEYTELKSREYSIYKHLSICFCMSLRGGKI